MHRNLATVFLLFALAPFTLGHATTVKLNGKLNNTEAMDPSGRCSNMTTDVIDNKNAGIDGEKCAEVQGM